MQITTHDWKELDLHEIARLTCAAKGTGGQTSAEAVERMVERLDDHMAALPRYAVLARSGDQLVGWLMLVVQNPAMGLGCDARNAQAIALYRALGWQDGGTSR